MSKADRKLKRRKMNAMRAKTSKVRDQILADSRLLEKAFAESLSELPFFRRQWTAFKIALGIFK